MEKYSANKRFSGVYDKLINTEQISNKADFAKKIGVGASTISEILGERQGVTVDLIQKICAVFEDVSPADFFDWKGNANVVSGNYNTSVAGNGNKVNSETDKFLDLLKKKDEQIDRLITIIEHSKK